MSLTIRKIKNISGNILQLHLHEFQIDEILDVSDVYEQWIIDDVIIALSSGLIEIL